MFDYDNELIILHPNQSFYFEIDAIWQDKEEYTQNGVYYEIVQTVTLPWQQHTQ